MICLSMINWGKHLKHLSLSYNVYRLPTLRGTLAHTFIYSL